MLGEISYLVQRHAGYTWLPRAIELVRNETTVYRMLALCSELYRHIKVGYYL